MCDGAAVCGSTSSSVRQYARDSVQQCGSVWQCVRQCAVVQRCGSRHGSACSSVRQCGNVRQCASVRQCAAVLGNAVQCGSVRSVRQCGSVRQCAGQCVVVVHVVVCVCLWCLISIFVFNYTKLNVSWDRLEGDLFSFLIKIFYCLFLINIFYCAVN
jgi:hypothetical protein